MTKKFLSVLAATAFSMSVAFAGSANNRTRTPASQMAPGTYGCGKDNGEMNASFYVRKDGTSKKVKILSAEETTASWGSDCYLVTYQWLDSGKTVKDTTCCISED